MDVGHFAIIECSHLANGCTIKCGCIGLILFHYLSCLGAMVSDINAIGFVSLSMQSLKLWLQVVQPFIRRPRNKMDAPR